MAGRVSFLPGDGAITGPDEVDALVAIGASQVWGANTDAELLDLAVEHGFAPVAAHEASQEEWDAFESGFTAGYATWLATHEPEHPDAAEVRGLARRQREGYFRGYRGTLGLAYLQLLAV